MSTPRTKKRHRIFNTLLIVLLLAGAIPLGLFGFKMININREELKTKQRTSQLAVAGALSEFIDSYIETQEVEIRSLASGLALGMPLLSGQEFLDKVRDREVLEGYLRENPNALKVVLLNRDLLGWEVSRADYAKEDSVEQLLAEGARGLLDGPQAAVQNGTRAIHGPPVFVDHGRACAIVFSAPIVGEGRTVGVVSAAVSLDPLQKTAEERSEGLYEVYVLDEDRRVLAYAGLGDAPDAGRLAASELAEYYFKNRDAGAQTISFKIDGPNGPRRMVGSYAYVADLPCGVFLQIDYDKAYYSVIRMRNATWKWIVGSLSVALLLCFLFARWLNGPISELTHGALRLAGGDFSHRIRIKSHNEVGQLADSFNFMSGRIERQIDVIRKAARENEELFLASIQMLSAAIDEKDPYTRGHSQRVTIYSEAIARRMGRPEGEIEKLRIAALLHDVGKIGIDDAILRKPANLTPEEYEIIKQHPEKGAVIMSPVKQLKDIVPVMRYHHERVNGSGYPAGLRGGQIPLAAQIISVADTFDAMTTERPYQRAMTTRYVAEKIKGWIDIRFERSVVDGFLAALDHGDLQPHIPTPENEPVEPSGSQTAVIRR